MDSFEIELYLNTVVLELPRGGKVMQEGNIEELESKTYSIREGFSQINDKWGGSITTCLRSKESHNSANLEYK